MLLLNNGDQYYNKNPIKNSSKNPITKNPGNFLDALAKIFYNHKQKPFMKNETKTLSQLCEEQKPFFVQKFDTTPEEQEKITREVVKEYMDHIKKLHAQIKIVAIKRPPSKFLLTIKRFLQSFNNNLTKKL